MTKAVHVAVGVIKRVTKGLDGVELPQYFLTKRLAEAHQGGKWEFPGGKVESRETVAQALARELNEEVGIDVLSCQPLITIEHTYPAKDESKKEGKTVCLEVFVVDNFIGEPKAQEGQGEGWFTLAQFKTLDFPEANKQIIEKLTLTVG